MAERLKTSFSPALGGFQVQDTASVPPSTAKVELRWIHIVHHMG